MKFNLQFCYNVLSCRLGFNEPKWNRHPPSRTTLRYENCIIAINIRLPEEQVTWKTVMSRKSWMTHTWPHVYKTTMLWLVLLPFLTSLLDANKTKSVEFDVTAAAVLSSSNVWCVLSRFSCIWLFVTLWIKGLPGSSVRRILQAGLLEWVAIPSSRGSSWPRDGAHITCGSCPAGRFFTAEPPGKPKGGV